MTPAQILAWSQAAQILLSAGVMTVATLKALFAGEGLTEAQQDEILQAVVENMRERKERSREIAEG